MRFFKLVLFVFFISNNLCLHAQIHEDSILLLDEVVLEANRLKNISTGVKVQSLDSTTLQNFRSNNLGEVLSQNTHIFIKTYGPGNLASISTRGSGASHTALLWNGFNIQSPTLGQADFSLFPVSFAEEIDIQYGGAGALFGSGAIGGIIHLNTPATYNTGVHASIGSTFGSFENYYHSINFKISKKRFISSVKFFNNSVTNNFPFINTTLPSHPKSIQKNAGVNQKGIMVENFFKIKDDQQINLRVWLQDNFRQVQPIMFNVDNTANRPFLKNGSLKLSSEWKKTKERATFFIRSAYFNDVLHYNENPGLISKTTYQTSITEAESNIYLKKNHLINVGLNYTYNIARSDGYPHSPDQHRTSAFASYKIHTSKNTWKASVSIREEIMQGKFVPFTPAAGFEGLLVKGITIKGNVSRNYKVPTFNDLYWTPGGNPDLLPEEGWSEEMSLLAQSKINKNSQFASVTIFNSNINNWIIWLPGAGTLWSAQNIQSVWSRGIESNLKVTQNIGRLKIDLSLLYNYVVSTNDKATSQNDQSYKKQLIYVPIYNAQGNLSLSYKNFYLGYIHTYTGNVFTSKDNSTYLQGYQLGNLFFNKKINIHQIQFNLNAKIYNIWNKNYQVVLWQPMPMRYFQIGASISFNKTNPTK